MQAWTLDNEGRVRARISSKGLSCNLDHWHHPYWRFDFALGEPSVHRVEVYKWDGSKVADITTEGSFENASFDVSPFYRIVSTQPPDIGDIKTPAEAFVVPPPLRDTAGAVGPTEFSPLDGYVRIYRPEEDRDWPHPPEEDIWFQDHMNCVDSDIVFWSVCHLFHLEHEGEDHWHQLGPDIVFRPMLLASVPPETQRRVHLAGNIDVKDFGVFEDEWEHMEFAEDIEVDPNAPHGELVMRLSSGDVTAELIIRVDWNTDASIFVRFEANLFDERERVARVENSFPVARDDSTSWGGIHLVDHHSGDPDTADMQFVIINAQA